LEFWILELASQPASQASWANRTSQPGSQPVSPASQLRQPDRASQPKIPKTKNPKIKKTKTLALPKIQKTNFGKVPWASQGAGSGKIPNFGLLDF